MKPVTYVVISPARNEQDYIERTIRSMARQSLQPARWIIVDDGSSDRTGAIADAAAREYTWIEVLHRVDRGFRKQGGGVVEAFYDGYQRIQSEPWEFLVKLDADLSFDGDFFARCFEKFAANPQLGIGGGLVCNQLGDHLVCESPRDPPFHVRGATKIYRRECWEAIGEVVKAAGWDTIDEFKANMLGWKTRSFRDIPLRHHRHTGSVDGPWKNYVKFGLGSYVVGYHPLFMLLKCIVRCIQKPYVVGAAGLWYGFCQGYVKRAPRVDDPTLIRYIRRQQLRTLMLRRTLWTASSE